LVLVPQEALTMLDPKAMAQKLKALLAGRPAPPVTPPAVLAVQIQARLQKASPALPGEGSEALDPLAAYDALWTTIARSEGVPAAKMKVDRIGPTSQRRLFGWTPDLRWYDLLLVNSSAGKDSLAMLDVFDDLAAAQGVRDRILVIHCDLGRVEHPGVRELAEEHAVQKGLPFVAVEPTTRGQKKDLIHRFEASLKTEKGSFPGFGTRYCTSEFKTAEAMGYVKAWVTERFGAGDLRKKLGRRVRVLNLLGLRAEESDARAGRGFKLKDETETRWVVHEWLPIQGWKEEQVWARIEQSGLRYHPAYDVGFKRLSCRLCPLAANEDVKLAALVYPEMAEEIVALERKYPHKKPFKEKVSLQHLRAEAERDPTLRAVAERARRILGEEG
jgi:3'-phosphoadenosine 5'-phosphosulfate sulfotransferase (PAPS reductase)/FAD synthetase